MKSKVYVSALMVLIVMIYSFPGHTNPVPGDIKQTTTSCSTPSTWAASNDGILNPSSTWSATVSQTITTDGCKVFQVVITDRTKEYTFKTGCDDGASASFDTYIEVYDSAGVWVMGNDDGCSDYRSTVTLVPANYVFYVKVRGYNSLNYGSFDLAYKYSTPAPAICKTPGISEDYTIAVTDSWQTHPATLTETISITSGACKVYEVTGIAPSTTYTFKTGCGDGSTANFDTFLELYDSEGNWIMGNDDGCSEYTSKIDWSSPASYSGVVYVKVRGYSDSKFGNYRMAYIAGAPAPPTTCSVPPSEFDYTIVPSGTWTTTVSTSVASDGCVVYRVENVDPSTNYSFKTGCGDGATANFDTWIELYNASGISLAHNDDGCSGYTSNLDWASPGTYTSTIYVKVRGYDSNKYGDFTMAYKKGAVPPSICQPIPTTTPDLYLAANLGGLSENDWGTTGSNPIVSDACYVIKFLAASGKTYTFKTGCDDGATADFDTYIEVYNATGVQVAADDDACSNPSLGDYSSRVVWTSTYDGNAFVKIRGYNSEKVGDFTCAFSWATTAGGSGCFTPPLFNASVTPTTTWAGDSQTLASGGCYVYEVTTTVGNDYTFETGCGPAGSVTPTATFDTYLELYSATGTLLAGNDDACEEYRSKLEWTAAGTTTNTTYFVKVRGYNASNYGTYTVAYKYDLPAQCTTPPNSDETLAAPTTDWQNGGSDAIESDGCYVYKVALTAGKTYTFKTGCADGATANFDTFIELYNTSGTWITEDDDACKVIANNDYTSKIEYAATFTGDAFIKVRGYNSNNYGTFTLAYRDNGTGSDALELGTREDVAMNHVKVYPNPANQSFTVASETSLSFTKITISEFTGRIVRSWNLDQPVTSFQVESTDFAQGVYILSIETSKGWIRKKVNIVR